jgi:hypothetical protein
MVQDLGSYFEDETKVTAMGIKGKSYVASFGSRTSSSKDNIIPDGRQRKELFNFLFISKHANIDILVDSGSQVNIISE